jgi:hypothetical protein
MGYIVFVLLLILIPCLVLLHGKYVDNKDLNNELDDYQFCCDCVAKLKHEGVEGLLVYSSEMNTSRRVILVRMGYKLTDEKEIPIARLPQLTRIEPWKDKRPQISETPLGPILNNYEK